MSRTSGFGFVATSGISPRLNVSPSWHGRCRVSSRCSGNWSAMMSSPAPSATRFAATRPPRRLRCRWSPGVAPSISPARHLIGRRRGGSSRSRARSPAWPWCTTWSQFDSKLPNPDRAQLFSCHKRRSDDSVRKSDFATALAQFDGPTDRAVALRCEPDGLPNQRVVERTLARELVDEPDLGEGLGPVRLPVTLGRNRQGSQWLLPLLQ